MIMGKINIFFLKYIGFFIWVLLIKSSKFFKNDRKYLEALFFFKMGYKLNLENPQKFCEKLQWLKLYNRKPEYTKMVDKVLVKQWVSEKIGSQYVIRNLGVYEKVEDIDFNKLPSRFVLKCNHNSRVGLCICKDKTRLNIKKVKRELQNGLNENHYLKTREWPYKNVQRRIIAEEYMEEEGLSSLNDYKVMCFGGKAKLIELHRGRYTSSHTQEFYDCDWNKTDISQSGSGSISNDVIPRPSFLEEMIELSECLSNGIPHVRVDWYYVNGHLFFGEMTFFDGAGFDPMDKEQDELLLGSWIDLTNIKQ